MGLNLPVWRKIWAIPSAHTGAMVTDIRQNFLMESGENVGAIFIV